MNIGSVLNRLSLYISPAQKLHVNRKYHASLAYIRIDRSTTSTSRESRLYSVAPTANSCATTWRIRFSTFLLVPPLFLYCMASVSAVFPLLVCVTSSARREREGERKFQNQHGSLHPPPRSFHNKTATRVRGLHVQSLMKYNL